MRLGPDWKRFIIWNEDCEWGWDPVEDFDTYEEAEIAVEKYECAYIEDTGDETSD